MTALLPPVIPPTDVLRASSTSHVPSPARAVRTITKRSNNAGVIAGSVVGTVVLICLIVVIVLFLLNRWRKQKESRNSEPTAKSFRHGPPSGADGTSPLLSQNDTGHKSIDSHGRILSDAAPLMQLVHHDVEAGAYANDIRNTLPPTPLEPLRQKESSIDTAISPESTYSQTSVSTRTYRGFELVESPTTQLPQIPRTEPLSNISDRVGVATRAGGIGSTRSHSVDQRLQSTRPNARGTSRSRNALPNTPMEPLMESEGSGSRQNNGNDNGHDSDRWSIAADPGGSHPRRLPTLNIQPYPLSSSTPRSATGGFGFSLLTSAFRKSLSASSIITETSANESHNQLQHYPSVASMGASSGTGSGTETYFTALSDTGTDGGRKITPKGPPGTTVGMNMINTSRPKTTAPSPQPLSSRARSSTPNPPSTSPGVNPLPPPPSLVVTGPPPQSPMPTHPNDPNIENQDQHAEAHIRFQSTQRVPHVNSSLAQARRSTHGVIDLI